MSHVLNEVEVSCLPGKLPEFIEVDLIDLQAGHSIHLADLKLPEGVELVALKHGDNGTVATILASWPCVALLATKPPLNSSAFSQNGSSPLGWRAVFHISLRTCE